jgi:hypothetical protein
MSYPTYTLSSSVMNVDTETTSKIIMLPPANTILGTSLYIRDSTGFASLHPVYVSTQLNDFLDNYATTILLDTDFQSLRVAPWSTTRYSILTNYIQGLAPFTYSLQGSYTFCNVLDPYNFNSAALSYTGEIQLVTASGGATASSNALYVSSNFGGSFSNEENIDASNVFFNEKCCMSYDGVLMFVTLNTGFIYTSSDTGVSWSSNATNESFTGVVCTSNGRDVFAISDRAVFSIPTSNLIPTVLWTDSLAGVTQFRSLCVGTDVKLGYILYVGCPEGKAFRTSDGISWRQLGTPSPSDTWQHLVCNSNGGIVYGLLTSISGNLLYKSEDKGDNWTQLTALSSYNLVTCDNTGTFVAVTGGPGTDLYFSVNGGSNFTQIIPSVTASALAMSGDANYLVAVQSGNAIGVGRGRLI